MQQRLIISSGLAGKYAALATRVWDRSPALAWLLDVPPPALFRAAASQWNHPHQQPETPDGHPRPRSNPEGDMK